jgi:two-component system, NarL family, response regulator NreC
MAGDKTRVIIVEDHDLMRSYLKRFIEQVDHCHIIAEAKDGKKAIEVIQSVSADLIVLDLRLPRLSGLSVIEASKKLSPAKILVVTMHADEDTIQQALDAGADGIVLKDKGAKVFEEAILSTLSGKRPVCLEEDCGGPL